MTPQPRVAPGVPDGGRYTAVARDEPDIALVHETGHRAATISFMSDSDDTTTGSPVDEIDTATFEAWFTKRKLLAPHQATDDELIAGIREYADGDPDLEMDLRETYG